MAYENSPLPQPYAMGIDCAMDCTMNFVLSYSTNFDIDIFMVLWIVL